jgi:hypothetical protein
VLVREPHKNAPKWTQDNIPGWWLDSWMIEKSGNDSCTLRKMVQDGTIDYGAAYQEYVEWEDDARTSRSASPDAKSEDEASPSPQFAAAAPVDMRAFSVIPCHHTRKQQLAWASNKRRAEDATGAAAEEQAIKAARRWGASP